MISSQIHFPTVKSVCRSKAVSDGVVIWHATSSVIARACRFQYGIFMKAPYDPRNAMHKERPTINDMDGRRKVCDVWSPIVKRVSWKQVIDDEVHATNLFGRVSFSNQTKALP